MAPQAFVPDPPGQIAPYFVPNSVEALLYAIDNHGVSWNGKMANRT